MPRSEFITCISSGALTESLNGCARVFNATNLNDPFVAAMKAMPDVAQCVAVDPCCMVKRDYRRASVEEVCASLTESGIEHQITKPF